MTRVSALGEYLRYRSALPPRLSEFAILVTAAQWQQQFEWDVHAPIALKAGIPQPVHRRAVGGASPAGSRDRDQQVLYDSASSCIAIDASAPATRERAVATLGEQGTIDAIGICGYYALLAMVLNSDPNQR